MSNSDFTNGKYPDPNQLTTEELLEILRLDLDTNDEDFHSDYQDYIFRVMDVLELRERMSDKDFAKQADDAWNRFIVENPAVFTQCHLAGQNYIEKAKIRQNPVQKKNQRRLSFLRILTATTLTLLLFATATASAFNFNIFSIIGQWTQDVFHLGTSNDERVSEHAYSENVKLGTSINDALHQIGITSEVAPSWFPDGFRCTEIDSKSFRDRTILMATLVSQNDFIIGIVFTQYLSLPENLLNDYEKNTASVDRYVSNGITHYILTNYEKASISWITDNIEVSITGDFSNQDAHKIIDSIYKENK